MRRRFERSKGLVVHLFCGSGRKVFNNISERNDFVHMDREEDLFLDDTFRFLLR